MGVRLYAVAPPGGQVSDLAYDAHHAHRCAAARRARGQQAELVYSLDPPESPNPVWQLAQAYVSGHAAGYAEANYAHAYRGADETTALCAEVPDRFAGVDGADYRQGFEDGVSDFWSDDRQ